MAGGQQQANKKYLGIMSSDTTWRIWLLNTVKTFIFKKMM